MVMASWGVRPTRQYSYSGFEERKLAKVPMHHCWPLKHRHSSRKKEGYAYWPLSSQEPSNDEIFCEEIRPYLVYENTNMGNGDSGAVFERWRDKRKDLNAGRKLWGQTLPPKVPEGPSWSDVDSGFS